MSAHLQVKVGHMAFIQLGLTVYLVSLALSHIYDPTTYPDLNFDTNTAYVLNHTQTYEDGFTYFNYTVSELEEGLLHFKTNNPAAMATEQVTYFNNSGVESEDGLTYFDIRTNMHILKSSWFPELAKGKYVYYFGKGYDNFCWPREVPPSDPLPSLFRSSQLKPWVQVPIRAAVLLGIACRLFQSMLICSKRIYFSSGDKLHVYISRIFVTNELIHNVSLYLVTNFLVSPDQRYAPFFGLSLVSAFATFALKMLFSFWHSGLRRVTAVRVVLFFLVSHAILPTYNSCMAYLGHNYCDPYVPFFQAFNEFILVFSLGVGELMDIHQTWDLQLAVDVTKREAVDEENLLAETRPDK